MDDLQKKFLDFILSMREKKPNDRSDGDRYWAIVITELEKAYAVFVTFADKQK